MKRIVKLLLSSIGIVVTMLIFIWLFFYLRGRRFALRDSLHNADAIVVLAGTRGNIKFLDGKICTAVRLYQKGLAPYIICSGRFSVKVTKAPMLIPLSELQEAVAKGRLQEKDISLAAKTWDTGLGANYMREKVIQNGVSQDMVLTESESLHTRENAEMVLEILRKYRMRRIILVTSPFHQLRTYLTFAKVFQPYGIEILNCYAETDEWHPFTWFLLPAHRKLVRSEEERIRKYREKGDLL